MDNTSIVALQKNYFLKTNQSQIANRTMLPVSRSNNIFTASVAIIFAVMSIALNSLILASWIRRPSLRTPFNSYVINLAAVDTLSAFFPMMQNIIRQLVGFWPGNGFSCTAIVCLAQTCNAGNRAAHLLIAANRFWAVTAPLSYRNHHNYPLSVCAVLVTWLLTLTFVTPDVVMGRRNGNYSPSTGDPNCVYDISSYRAYHMTFSAVTFNMPEILILLVYAWLVFKLRQKNARNIHNLSIKTERNEAPEPAVPTTSLSKAHSSSTTLKDTLEAQTTPGAEKEAAGNSKSVFSRLPGGSGQAELRVPENEQSKGRQHSSRAKGHNRLFAYLLLPVILCWTPNNVYYLWSDITGSWNAPMAITQIYLSYVNSWMNPILMYLADRQIRKAVNDLLKCR